MTDMQRTLPAQRTIYGKNRFFEETVYGSLLAGFLGVVTYLVAHCYHAL